tara:strand:- start:142 stop:420 length:279 start_codon:yes stop_codon:yes gene_type:complete
MPHIQVCLTKEEDSIIKAASVKERRSKTSQFKLSAIEHALTLCPELKIGKPLETPKSIRKTLVASLTDYLAFGKPTIFQQNVAIKLRNALKA